MNNIVAHCGINKDQFACRLLPDCHFSSVVFAVFFVKFLLLQGLSVSLSMHYHLSGYTISGFVSFFSFFFFFF